MYRQQEALIISCSVADTAQELWFLSPPQRFNKYYITHNGTRTDSALIACLIRYSFREILKTVLMLTEEIPNKLPERYYFTSKWCHKASKMCYWRAHTRKCGPHRFSWLSVYVYVVGLCIRHKGWQHTWSGYTVHTVISGSRPGVATGNCITHTSRTSWEPCWINARRGCMCETTGKDMICHPRSAQ